MSSSCVPPVGSAGSAQLRRVPVLTALSVTPPQATRRVAKPLQSRRDRRTVGAKRVTS
jgi:hypothetical protein